MGSKKMVTILSKQGINSRKNHHSRNDGRFTIGKRNKNNNLFGLFLSFLMGCTFTQFFHLYNVEKREDMRPYSSTLESLVSLPKFKVSSFLPQEITFSSPLTLNSSSSSLASFSVAITMCITSKIETGFEDQLDNTALVKIMFPSLIETMERDKDKVRYGVFLGYDHDDVFWSDEKNQNRLRKFVNEELFEMQMQTDMQEKDRSNLPVFFVGIPKTEGPDHIPFNELLKTTQQYSDPDYYVRINDDTQFQTHNWTMKGIEVLQRMTPANVGVAGPLCLENLKILTHDMVHKTHMQIFNNEYYPDIFHNWYMDDWISAVYGNYRTRTVYGWLVKHHINHHGTRYNPWDRENELQITLTEGKRAIRTWLKKQTELGIIETYDELEIEKKQKIVPDFTITVVIADFEPMKDNSAATLKRLLDLLEASDYGDDYIHLRIKVNYEMVDEEQRTGEMDPDTELNKVLLIVHDFQFTHGNKTIIIDGNPIPTMSWYGAWTPKHDKDFGIIFEADDIVELAPSFWYLRLKKMWSAYYYININDSGNHKKDSIKLDDDVKAKIINHFAGISLQKLVPQQPNNDRLQDNDNGSIITSKNQSDKLQQFVPFLYPQTMTNAFSPHPKYWKMFVDSIGEFEPYTIEKGNPGENIIRDWWRSQDSESARILKSSHFLSFTIIHNLTTLYANLPNNRTQFELPLAMTNSLAKPSENSNNKPNLHFPPFGSLQQFVEEGTDVGEMASKLQKKHGVLLMHFLNAGYVEPTKSWICNIKLISSATNSGSSTILERTMFVTTDIISHNSLKKFDPNLNVVLVPYDGKKAAPIGRQMDYGQFGFHRYMLFRTELISSLLENNITIFLVEADATWFRDPTNTVLRTKGDIVTMNDNFFDQPEKLIQGGFQLLRPTMNTKLYWNIIRKKLESIIQEYMDIDEPYYTNIEGSEQVIANNIIRDKRISELTVGWLPETEFIPGYYYDNKENKNKHSVSKINNDKALLSSLGIKREEEVGPAVILNNYIVSNEEKFQRAKEWGNWFLSSNNEETDASCANA